MRRKPTLDETEFEGRGHWASPDNLSYWAKRDRWVQLGRLVAELRDEARRLSVPIESLPGAPTLIAAFQALGRELDRRAR